MDIEFLTDPTLHRQHSLFFDFLHFFCLTLCYYGITSMLISIDMSKYTSLILYSFVSSAISGNSSYGKNMDSEYLKNASSVRK